MINIKFKECCNDCKYLDMEHDQEDMFDRNGEEYVYLEIGCIHSDVCSRYLAEEKDK